MYQKFLQKTKPSRFLETAYLFDILEKSIIDPIVLEILISNYTPK